MFQPVDNIIEQEDMQIEEGNEYDFSFKDDIKQKKPNQSQSQDSEQQLSQQIEKWVEKKDNNNEMEPQDEEDYRMNDINEGYKLNSKDLEENKIPQKRDRKVKNTYGKPVKFAQGESNLGGIYNAKKEQGRYRDGKVVVEGKLRIDLKESEVLQNQYKFRTEGLEIYFPFKPYQCQIDFMAKVILALNKGENALLESPTGTGKTLSLLCATISWLKAEREKMPKDVSYDLPKIIYTSRTHSQLAQVSAELKNTAYNPRSIIIGSRDHFCVHPQIQLLRGIALTNACKKAQKGLDPCAFYKNREMALKSLSWEPLDIEDMHRIGKEMMICPYFANKDRAQGADVIFMPYNYLIDEKIRENFDIKYQNCIIIFDEAHNIAQAAEDVSSFEIKSKQLDMVAQELERLQEERVMNQDRIFDSKEEDVQCIIQITKAFKAYLDDYDLESAPKICIDNNFIKKDAVVLKGNMIFDILFTGTQIYDIDRITQKEKKISIETDWPRISMAFELALTDIATLSNYSMKPMTENWYEVLKKVNRIWKKGSLSNNELMKHDPLIQNDINDFYLYLFDEEDTNNQMVFNPKRRKGLQYEHKTVTRVLSFWCFNAGIGFREIQALKPRSIILTSGTLSPLSSFQAELQVNFEQRIENPHVISPDQVNISILKKGTLGNMFNFNYNNRDKEETFKDLGLTISKISTLTPGGILIFFPSYWFLEKCYEAWEQNGAMEVIEQTKKVFKEPKDATKYQSTIDAYYQAIFGDKKTDKKSNWNGKSFIIAKKQKQNDQNINGAILLGVCRGKISEGMDFSDKAARCVIMIGIPYPQITDPKVILKKHYLDEKVQKSHDQLYLSGKDWYNQQATRSVNQAIGRVIRHAQDYGSIILMDERYSYYSNKSQISKWLRDQINFHNDFESLSCGLIKFFGQMDLKGFVPKVDQLKQLKIDMEEEEILDSKKKTLLRKNQPQENQNEEGQDDDEDEYGNGQKLGFLNTKSNSDIPQQKKDLKTQLNPFSTNSVGLSKPQQKMTGTINNYFQKGNNNSLSNQIDQFKKRKVDEINSNSSNNDFQKKKIKVNLNVNNDNEIINKSKKQKNIGMSSEITMSVYSLDPQSNQCVKEVQQHSLGFQDNDDNNNNNQQEESKYNKHQQFGISQSNSILQQQLKDKFESQTNLNQSLNSSSNSLKASKSQGDRLNEFTMKGLSSSGLQVNNLAKASLKKQQQNDNNEDDSSMKFGISSNNNNEKIKRNSEVIFLMRQVLKLENLIQMGKVLQDIKVTKASLPISDHFKNIKHLFFGVIKDVRLDKEFIQKKNCLEQLCNTLPMQRQKEFQQYFGQLLNQTEL